MKKLLKKPLTTHYSLLTGGFTLIELMVVMGMAVLLIGYATIGLFGAKQKSSLNTTLSTLIADLKHQQLKAMVGDTEGRATHDVYGIYFETDQYTLFHGLIFNPSDIANFAIPLGDNIQATNILFPNSQIRFASVSGEIADFATGLDGLTLRDTQTGQTKLIKMNRYGVITQVN